MSQSNESVREMQSDQYQASQPNESESFSVSMPRSVGIFKPSGKRFSELLNGEAKEIVIQITTGLSDLSLCSSDISALRGLIHGIARPGFWITEGDTSTLMCHSKGI
jgi:hypothetical protein